MNERPELSIELKYDHFLEYYYLKEELIAFCKDNKLPIIGSKQEITERVTHFLKTGERMVFARATRKNVSIAANNISLESVIEENFVCSEKHRTFFKSVIGDKFSFNVVFQKYLKNSAGKTYSDAVKEWHKIQEDKKKSKGRSTIESQFEYNTYIRDFFKDNKGKTLEQAIKCWKYKKSMAGHNRYEGKDLCAIGGTMIKTMKIETKRLIIRPYEKEDMLECFKLMQNKELFKYMDMDVMSLEEYKSLFYWIIDCYNTGIDEDYKYSFAITLKENGIQVGWCGIGGLQYNHSDKEIYFLIGRDYWGMGYAKEASQALLAYGFNYMGIEKLAAIVKRDNIASKKVIESMGLEYKFVVEGLSEEFDFFNGNLYYSLIKDKFINK